MLINNLGVQKMLREATDKYNYQELAQQAAPARRGPGRPPKPKPIETQGINPKDSMLTQIQNSIITADNPG